MFISRDLANLFGVEIIFVDERSRIAFLFVVTPPSTVVDHHRAVNLRDIQSSNEMEYPLIEPNNKEGRSRGWPPLPLLSLPKFWSEEFVVSWRGEGSRERFFERRTIPPNSFSFPFFFLRGRPRSFFSSRSTTNERFFSCILPHSPPCTIPSARRWKGKREREREGSTVARQLKLCDSEIRRSRIVGGRGHLR